MNHVSVEEVEAQPDAVIGKFLVKSFTALVLFDTLDREDIFSIPMEEVARTITTAPRMVMAMEEATARTVPTHQPQPRKT